MKRFLLFFLFLFAAYIVRAQTGYYRITTTAKFNALGSTACDGSYSRLTAYFNDGSSVDLRYDDLNGTNEDDGKDVASGTTDFINTKRITRLVAHNKRRIHRGLGGNCRDEDEGDLTINVSSGLFPCGSTSTTGEDNGGSFRMTLKYEITPVNITVSDAGTNPDYLLPSDDRITLNTNTGYPASVYTWQYSFDGLTYSNFPSALQGSRSVSFSAKEILGNDLTNYIGKNIFFRLSYPCGNRTSTNILTYNIIPSAPTITSSYAINTSCYDSENGGFGLRFNRDLYSGERLSFSVRGPIDDSEANIEQLSAGNTYVWARNNLPKGSYTIEMIGRYTYTINGQTKAVNTYTNGITRTANVEITSPPRITFSASGSDIYCYNAASGKIMINSSGGSGSFRAGIMKEGQSAYTWHNFSSANSDTISGLYAGRYFIIVRDENDCFARSNQNTEKVETLDITQPVSPLVFDGTPYISPPQGAYGLRNRTIRVTVKGGTPESNGTYSFEWIDSSGNLLSDFSAITGMDSYTISLNNTGAGLYTLRVYDKGYLSESGSKNGCYIETQVSIEEPAPLAVSVDMLNPLLCNGNTDGALEAAGSGGELQNGTYNYTWYKLENGSYRVFNQYAKIASGLNTGTYRVRITDKNGLSAESAPFVLGEPASITSQVNFTPVNCFGGTDGTITLTTSGGTGAFRAGILAPGEWDYVWSGFNQGTRHLISGLSPGTYTLVIRDANNCFEKNADGSGKVITVQIAQPAAALSISDIRLSDPLAAGSTDGSIKLMVQGGTTAPDGSYRFEWTDRNGSLLQNYTTAEVAGKYEITLNGAGAGEYTLKVYDNRYATASSGQSVGCYATQSFTLTEPDPLIVSLSLNSAVICNDYDNGALQASASGGKLNSSIPQYQYEWFRIENGIQVQVTRSGAIAASLKAGTYIVRVTDANNIQASSAPFTLTEPDPLVSTVTRTDVRCYEGSDGTIRISTSGGSGTYSAGILLPGRTRYTWTDFNEGASHRFDGLPKGSYQLMIHDSNGCYQEDASGADIVHTILIGQPNAPLAISGAHINRPQAYGQSNGSVTVKIKGGTAAADGSYRYEWLDENGNRLNTSSGSLTGAEYTVTLSQLAIGTYRIRVYDQNYENTSAGNIAGCFTESSYNVTQPAKLTVGVALTSAALCKDAVDGILTAHGNGGVEFRFKRYLYEWFEIVNGQRISIQQQDSVAIDLHAGTYMVQLTDSNSISVSSDLFVLTEPAALYSEITNTAVNCYAGADGTIRISTTGGSGHYSIGLSRPGETDFTWQEFNRGASHSLGTLPGGVYRFYIRDNNGCFQKNAEGREMLFTVTLDEPLKPLSVESYRITEPLAYGRNDGSITVKLSGGTPRPNGSYRLEWFNDQEQVLMTYTITGNQGYAELKLSSVAKGLYRLRVYDEHFEQAGGTAAAGCYTEQVFNVNEPPLLTVAISQTQLVMCKGESNASLMLHAAGGIPYAAMSYQYNWYRLEAGNAVPLNQHNVNAAGLNAGRYRVQITDANQIDAWSEPFTVHEPDLLEVELTGSRVECNAGADGTVSSIVKGGTPPYMYEWSNGETVASIKNAGAGKYFLFVTDAHGCQAQAQGEVSSPGSISVTPVLKDPVCYQSCDGVISLSVTGGTAPYTFRWSNGATSPSVTNLCAGVYTVVISDVNGCGQTQQYTLKEPSPLIVDLGAGKTLCNDQSYELNVRINDPAATYEWTSDNGFSASVPNVSLSASGNYQVRVTNSKGCTATGSITIHKTTAVISAEFLVSSQVFAQEDVTFVNISNPDPEQSAWIVPNDVNISVVSKNKTSLVLNFKQAGDYTLGLKGYSGNCEKLFSRKVTVLEKQAFADVGTSQDPFIKEFIIYPNPSSGQFSAKVELAEKADIRLRMVDVQSGQTFSDKKYNSNSSYLLPYNLNLAPGIYVMILETPKGNRIFRVMVN